MATRTSRSDEELLNDGMITEDCPMDLSDSIGKINLSGILNKTLEGTNEMLKWIEDDEATSANQTETNTSEETFFENKVKKLTSSLIILAKASHHRMFMEMCLSAKTPPRSMRLWVEPHIYHTTV